ncbi:MAG: response regulator transcription factor [Alphaproteobacteria bacterium]|nr:response regulator transcription factor [Alphaproteobacteria bacterium]
MKIQLREGPMAKILLIEDEAPVREMLLDELTVQGHKVIEAANGEEGLQKFLETEPDLVLCDRAMPGMSGFDVLERIRGAHPQFIDVPFIFLTALTDARDKAAVDHLNPAAYIEKPVDFEMLSSRIDALLNRA